MRKNTAHVQNLAIEFTKERGYYETKIVLSRGKKENLQKFCRETSKSIDEYIKDFLEVLTGEVKFSCIPLFINKQGAKRWINNNHNNKYKSKPMM